MQDLPHLYTVSARALSDSTIVLTSTGLPQLVTAAPAEFGGPGNQWSPEELLVGAVADCFILTFRAIARASKLDWVELKCTADGTLERIDRVTKFTAITVNATLTISDATDLDKANRLLIKAEDNCLISNSLSAQRHLETDVVVQS